MDTVNISLEFLASVLGTTPVEITDTLKSEDGWKSQSEIDKYFKSAFQDKLKAVRKEGHDEGHGRGTRESLSSKEKEIQKKFGLEAGDMDSLVQQIFEKAKGKGGQEMTEDDIKSSEFFQNAIAKLNKKLEAKEGEVQALQTRIQSEALDRNLRQLATSILDNEEAGFVLPEDQSIRETQFNLYMQQLKSNKWKITDDGILPVDDKGNVLQDDTFNNITAKDLAVSLAKKQFPQAQGKPRKAPSIQTGKPAGGTDGKTYTFPQLKTFADVTNHMTKLTDTDEINAFEAHVKEIADTLEG